MMNTEKLDFRLVLIRVPPGVRASQLGGLSEPGAVATGH
jgi:hypothetical protein